MSRQTVYLVQRVGMKVALYTRLPGFYPSSGEDGPDGVPLRAFTDRETASACRDALEREARLSAPPVLFTTYRLPVPASQVTSTIRDLGLEPPDLGPDTQEYQQRKQQVTLLRRWWSEQAPSLTPEQWSALWDRLFPDWRFYQVAEVVLEG